MHHIAGKPREQLTLLPEAVEDYIGSDNPVRFIDAFVNTLDLASLGFLKVDLADTGRPPYQPADLLKLYIYGYLNRVRSSRRLERETQRNLEIMWLLGKLAPDHKTISNFRRDNRAPLRLVCRQFVLLCKKLDLFGAELVAIDGSKFSAVNAKRRNFTKKQLVRLVQQIDTTVEEYLEVLETNDRQEAPHSTGDPKTLQEKIDSLTKRSAEYQRLLQILKENGQSQLSLTDPDARLMDHHGRLEVCYNVQTAVDSKHKLIVEHEVTNDANDRLQLAPLANSAKEALNVDRLEVCADKGYWSGTQVKACDDANIITYIPEHAPTGKRKSNIPAPGYEFARFQYDKERNVYHCPQGKELKLMGQYPVRGQARYHYQTTACKTCAARALCTANKNGRVIYRTELEDTLQQVRERIRQQPNKIIERMSLSEHPFGTLKHTWGHKAFLTRGLESVRAEMSLSILAYNIRRVISILGVPSMINRLAGP
jgi:transposase